MKTRKATGLDGIGARTLKALSEKTAAALAIIINCIVVTQRIPLAWKRSWVAPVPKCSQPTSTDHFRPIAIMDSAAKILDKHLIGLLRPYTRCNPRQFGFCERTGCGDALMRLQLDVLELCPRGTKSAVTMVSLDARKAFDRLSHSAIIGCFTRNGAPAWLLRIIASWLREREVQVRVGEGGRSRWRRVTSGAPQGAGLSAHIFRTVIDPVFDLPLKKGTRILGFADDLMVLRATPTPEDVAALQEDLCAIQGFLEGIGLALNAKKTQVLHVSLSTRGHSPGELRLDGQVLREVQELKYLGCTLDRRLNFNSHWARVSSSCKSVLGALSRLVHKNPVALKHLYTERVSSVILHSLPFIPPSTQESWRRLNGVAGYTAHILLNNWKLHGTEIVRKAGLAPPSELCFTQSMKFVYKCAAGIQRYGTWTTPDPRAQANRGRRRATRTTGWELQVPKTHLQVWKSFQPIRALLVYNSLPFDAAKLDISKCMSSYRAFCASLPQLYACLSSELRKKSYGEVISV